MRKPCQQFNQISDLGKKTPKMQIATWCCHWWIVCFCSVQITWSSISKQSFSSSTNHEQPCLWHVYKQPIGQHVILGWNFCLSSFVRYLWHSNAFAHFTMITRSTLQIFWRVTGVEWWHESCEDLAGKHGTICNKYWFVLFQFSWFLSVLPVFTKSSLSQICINPTSSLKALKNRSSHFGNHIFPTLWK